jgi:urea transport system substrate-binding protein
MRRAFQALLGLLLAAALLSWAVPYVLERTAPIRIGLLHSETGPFKISEQSILEAEILAVEEINEQGGLLGGRKVVYVKADGRSDWPAHAREAERLIAVEKVSAVIGCYTSASRKSVKPVVEAANHLLIYPNAYEGLEDSPNIIYTGAAPNQHIIPAVKWSYDRLKARRYFLAGSDHIWPRGVNATVKDYLNALGAEVVGEEYLLLDSVNVGPLVAKIKETRPDVILSTVTGKTNFPFYTKLAAVGLGPDHLPVVAFGIGEEELRTFPVKDMTGDYTAWNYFQSLDVEANRKFVEKFKARYGRDRVVSDAIAMAYNSVRLWAQAVEEGQTEDVATVRRLIAHQSLIAPGGVVSIDPETRHTWRRVYIGRIRHDGQFDIVWTSGAPVRPIPYPKTRSRHEWDAFLQELNKRWGGQWTNPARDKPSNAFLARREADS